MSQRNTIAQVEVIEKTGQRRNQAYVAKCYGVFTPIMDYWYSGFPSVCLLMAQNMFASFKQDGVACELIDAIRNESLDEFIPKP